MKRVKNLYDNLCCWENIYLAARKARKRKRSKSDVQSFEYDLEENLMHIQFELEQESYHPGKYRRFRVTEPKERDICAAPYKDRVVHHALINVIEPIWGKEFYYHSYACRVGKGMHKAITVCHKYVRRNKYVLKCDISKYFASIDYEILKSILSRKIGDEKLLKLIYLVIDESPEQESPAVLFPGDDLYTLMERKRGIPIGNLTSQFFANVYLNELDKFIKHKCKVRDYLRYMDDFLLFSDSKEYLTEIRKELEKFLNGMRLELHSRKTQILPVKNGVKFLGFQIFRGRIRLQKENIRRFEKRMNIRQKQYADYEIDSDTIKQGIVAWIGHAGHGNTRRLISKLLYKYSFKRDKAKQRTGFCVAGRGTTTTTIYVPGIATTTTPLTRTTISDSVVPVHQKTGCLLYGADGVYDSPALFLLARANKTAS
ncbi:MAG: reverse transcriptase/maturase family protein [Candidatus Stygibacter frigidus]|nr:reverse transcriptase/maturase family protein [Candidatus Stygibacter frigidus]